MLCRENSILNIPAWLPPNNEPKKIHPLYYPRLTSYLQTGAEKQEQTRTESCCHVPPRTCLLRQEGAAMGSRWQRTREDFASKELNTWYFYLGTTAWKSAHWLFHSVHHVASTKKKKKKHLIETIWRAGMNILQIISVGRIPFLATIFCAICQ